jgi:hypothetical protein
MDKGDDKDLLERWVRLMNKGQGYAGVFNYENVNDKRIVELSTVQEWCESIEAEYGVVLGVPQPNLNDPPDFFVSLEGRRLNVELVQMVGQEHKKRAVKGESPYSGQLFLDVQWSKERLIAKLSELIIDKGKKYRKLGLEIDVLVIHTAELWLNSRDALSWLSDVCIEGHENIHAVFLIFEYEPGRQVNHWPIMSIYCNLAEFSVDKSN